MNEYKEKLSSFAQQLKKDAVTPPMQEVRPLERSRKIKSKEKIVRTTIHLPASVHKKVKLQCVQQGISFKDFVTDLIVKTVNPKN